MKLLHLSKNNDYNKLFYFGLLDLFKDYFLLFLINFYNKKIDNNIKSKIFFKFNNFKLFDVYGHVYCNFLTEIKKTNKKLDLNLFIKKINLYFKKKMFIKKIIIKNNFINFFLTYKTFIFFFKNKKKDIFINVVRNNFKKILVEYGGINPNGEIHIGHMRNLLYGNILFNIYNLFFDNVVSHFLVNDQGNQMDIIFNAVLNFSLKNVVDDIVYKNVDIKFLYEKILDNNLDNFKQKIIDFFLNKMKKKINLFNFKKFDLFVYESNLRNNKILIDQFFMLFKKIIEYDKENNKIFIILKDKKKCLSRNSKFTYFFSDCLYTLYKMNSDYDKIITVISSDHRDYIKLCYEFFELCKQKKNSCQELYFFCYNLVLLNNRIFSKRMQVKIDLEYNIKNIINIKWFLLNFNYNKLINIRNNNFYKYNDVYDFIEFVLKEDSFINFNYKKFICIFTNELFNNKNKLIIKKYFFDEFIFIISIIDNFYVCLLKIIDNYNNLFLLINLFNDIIHFYRKKYQKKHKYSKNKLIYCLYGLLNYFFIKICIIFTLL